MRPALPPWHALPADEVVARLDSDPRAGLATAEVERRHDAHGDNALPEPRRRSLASVFVAQFQNPLIYLLFGASALALAMDEPGDAIVIFVVVVLNAAIGAIQEGRAEHALAALRRMTPQHARVVRDGHERVVDARGLVPGDLVVLAAGDAVAADLRLLEAASLQISEAALTGESVPVAKAAPPVAGDAALGDRTCMAYAGTLVTAGRARGVVTVIGRATEIGHIAELAATTRAPRTLLERRIDHFGRLVMIGAGVLLIVFLAVGTLRGLPIAAIAMIAISQVVGLVPEGLPVAMSIASAVGVQRMARRGAIVRRLSAVETLGATTVICSDKTGTLTRNEMTATALWLPPDRELAITGGADRRAPGVERLLEAFVLCNDAQVAGPQVVGDPTETALVVAAVRSGLDPEAIRRRAPRSAELPFDPEVKMMATQHGARVVIKGAPACVLALCRDVDPARVDAAVDRMARRALRVLAFAEVEDAGIDDRAGYERFRGRATLLGLVGEIDPPRDEAIAAVASCRTAGIRPVMITGDHVVTAVAVARTLGLARGDDVALDGAELARLSDPELAARLDRTAVFARVQPAQKLRIVDAYQRRGDVVAMTGDGVNDAPALMRADVGVAMGITGTDVAKQAAKVVLTDDNFQTIVAAVEEGRVVYRNIKSAVLLLVSTSIAEVVVLLLAIALGYPPPFVAVQILWNNLVTEGVITVNLVMDPGEGDEMRRPPTSPDEPLITRSMRARIAVMTPTIVVATLGWYLYRITSGVPQPVAGAETFTLLAVCEWFNVLNCLSERRTALGLRLFRNPWLVGGLVAGNLLQAMIVFVPAFHGVFHTVPFQLDQVIAIGVAGSLVLWTEELRKLVVRIRAPATPSASRPRSARPAAARPADRRRGRSRGSW